MHAAFLYHAIHAGLDMGIVNAGQLMVYADIPPDLLEHVEDVIFDRRPDATDRLVTFASTVQGEATKRELDLSWREQPVAQRLAHALVHGIVDFIEEDAEEARAAGRAAARRDRGAADGRDADRRRPVRRREDVPAPGREERARDEAGGRLPRAVHGGRDARPEATAYAAQGKIVLATVKGDVHDIGKNIVGVVLGCNSYEVIDLGVMVPADRILDTAVAEGADAVGLSGLITPSLDEMVSVAREMERRGLDAAAADRRRDDLAAAHGRQDRARVQPPTVHVLDASRVVGVVSDLLDPGRRDGLDRANRERAGAAARAARARRSAGRCSRSREARANRERLAFDDLPTPAVHRRTRLVEPDARDAARVRRLAVLLPRVGAEGQVPGDPRQPGGARELYDDARRCSTRSSRDGGSSARGRLRLLAGARRGRRRRARRTAAPLPLPAPAGGLSGDSRAEPLPRRLRRARPATTSARSRSAIHGADELAAPLRGRARRLPRDHGQGARRPARRGVRRVAARAGAARVVRARRGARRARS